MKNLYSTFTLIGVLGLSSGPLFAQSKQQPITVSLELSQKALDMPVLIKNYLGYMPTGTPLIDEKPVEIVKEPLYRGKPRYGAFRLGNGPHSVTYFAIDEIKGETGRIYIDFNQNGDLTDDGSGIWDEAKESDGIVSYKSVVTLHASWGSPVKESESGSYTLLMYRRHGDPQLWWTKITARSGKLTLQGKTYPVLLAENTSDGIFTVPKPGDRTRRPVQLFIDLDGDGTWRGVQTVVNGKKIFKPEQFDLARPFQIEGQWWDGFPSISGAELTLVPSASPGASTERKQEPVEEKSLLAAGGIAPDFVADTQDGKTIRLSSLKGKVVLLDFWATWCGPCQASMPGLQKIYNQVKNQGVVVFSVNVWDAKDPFDAWIAKNSGKTYSFTFAFDPAGRDDKKSIATAKYNVSGIPTMYVIDRDGKIKGTIVGSGNEKNIVKALTALGIKTSTM